jgi:hypothetical protein
MMLKIRHKLELYLNSNILDFTPGYFKVIRFSISQKDINTLALYLLLWASTLEGSKVSGVLGTSSRVIYIHEELQIDQFHLVCVKSINFVQVLHLGNKGNGVFIHIR